MNIPENLPTLDRLIECLKASSSGPGRMDRARDLAALVKTERMTELRDRAQREADELYRRSFKGRLERILYGNRGKR